VEIVFWLMGLDPQSSKQLAMKQVDFAQSQNPSTVSVAVLEAIKK